VPRCSGSKPDGSPCQRIVGASDEYCFAHDPERAAERRRNAAKAGRSRPNRELQSLKEQANRLYGEVRSGAVAARTGAVLVQLTNVQARLLELERRWREIEEIEERLERLEDEQAERRAEWG
jgi:hypothetical protein